jgi:hypothetical protein
MATIANHTDENARNGEHIRPVARGQIEPRDRDDKGQRVVATAPTGGSRDHDRVVVAGKERCDEDEEHVVEKECGEQHSAKLTR